MLQVQLIPDLSHCIETVARKDFQSATRQLLVKGVETEELQEKAETLRLFLETANFQKLRAESEKHLVAGREVTFTVCLKNGAPLYDINVTQLETSGHKNLPR